MSIACLEMHVFSHFICLPHILVEQWWITMLNVRWFSKWVCTLRFGAFSHWIVVHHARKRTYEGKYHEDASICQSPVKWPRSYFHCHSHQNKCVSFTVWCGALQNCMYIGEEAEIKSTRTKLCWFSADIICNLPVTQETKMLRCDYFMNSEVIHDWTGRKISFLASSPVYWVLGKIPILLISFQILPVSTDCKRHAFDSQNLEDKSFRNMQQVTWICEANLFFHYFPLPPRFGVTAIV